MTFDEWVDQAIASQVIDTYSVADAKTAWNAALEEAALTVDALARETVRYERRDDYEEAAAAIRALKD